ncbi:MAG: cysteine hydrolase [Armatimonadetes bacterium]|nr:cysteine hydrolase [Armatimonadota bacterium]
MERDAPATVPSTARRDYLVDFVPQFTLEPPRTALLVIDLQYASASRTHGLGRLLAEQGREADGQYRFDRIERVVVPNVRTLLEFFRRRGLRVIYLTVGSLLPDYRDMPAHMHGFARAVGNTQGRREHEILDEVRPEPGEIVMNKTTTGAFNSTSLDATLRTLGIVDLVITGVSTNSCVETTARDAADRGYRCVLVEDGCGAARPEFHEATLASFRRLFGRVASTREVIEELTAVMAR